LHWRNSNYFYWSICKYLGLPLSNTIWKNGWWCSLLQFADGFSIEIKK
jgi:hypothetical protein